MGGLLFKNQKNNPILLGRKVFFLPIFGFIGQQYFISYNFSISLAFFLILSVTFLAINHIFWQQGVGIPMLFICDKQPLLKY